MSYKMISQKMASIGTHFLLACVMCFADATLWQNRQQCAFGEEGVWRQRGFEDFRKGTFGNGGQNLYVSRSGVLQRIFQFDLNHDGFLDLVFCNSHGKDESPPAFVYLDPIKNPEKRVELIADGAVSGTVADLNGDGEDDLILAMADNGIRGDLNSYIYFGSPKGFSERQLLLLPAPGCVSAAADDFNGDGKLDVAFLLGTKVRVYYQDELGFEPKRCKDLSIAGMDIAADHLTGKETADLIVRAETGDIAVYWGAKAGLSEESYTPQKALGPAPEPPAKTGIASYPELQGEALPVMKVICIGTTPYLFAADKERVNLVPVGSDRLFGKPIRLECRNALSIATGDVNGDDRQDLVVATRERPSGQKNSAQEQSWVYWGTKSGDFVESNRTPLESHRACDVIVTDLDGDSCDDVVLCQYYTVNSYTSTSRIYRGSREGHFTAPIEIVTNDARRVLAVGGPGHDAAQLAFVNRMGGDRIGNPDVNIYWGDDQGFDPKRGTTVAAWGAVESLPTDLNDDGLADLVIGNGAEDSISRDPGTYVFLNTPRGLPHEPTLRLPTARTCGVTGGDLNHDGFLDLICVGFTNSELLIFFGNGPGIWDTQHPQKIHLEFDGVVCTEPRWIYLADFNDDSWLDLVVPMIESDRSVLLWGSAEGFSAKRFKPLPVFQAACAQAADLLGTGRLDLVFGCYKTTIGTPHNSFAYLFWNGLDGLRQDRCTQLPAAGACSEAVADFNNDGTLDLFLGSYHATLDRDTDSFIYWNRKLRGFSARDRTRLFTHSASGTVAADFNGDGWNDLAIANHKVEGDHCGWSMVWWNGPDGFNPNHVTKLPTTGPHGMTCISPNNQRDRGPEEYYESIAFELPAQSQLTTIDWKADLSQKTWLKAQVRIAESNKDLANAAWFGAKGAGTWFAKAQSISPNLSGRWVQYRLALGATNGVASPRVREVSIAYQSNPEAAGAPTTKVSDSNSTQ